MFTRYLLCWPWADPEQGNDVAIRARSIDVNSMLGKGHQSLRANLAIVRQSPPLPSRFPNVATPSAPVSVETVAPTNHVLVIEDDEALRALYAEILTDEGYRTTIWPAIPSTPNAIRAVAPDLILLDLVFGPIPNSGLTFMAHLKAEPETAAIPVLVCTARARFDAAEQARLTSWSCRVLTKPFNLDEFLADVLECLQPRIDDGIHRLAGMRRFASDSPLPK